jgi:hypothetical protein
MHAPGLLGQLGPFRQRHAGIGDQAQRRVRSVRNWCPVVGLELDSWTHRVWWKEPGNISMAVICVWWGRTTALPRQHMEGAGRGHFLTPLRTKCDELDENSAITCISIPFPSLCSIEDWRKFERSNLPLHVSDPLSAIRLTSFLSNLDRYPRHHDAMGTGTYLVLCCRVKQQDPGIWARGRRLGGCHAWHFAHSILIGPGSEPLR